VVVGELARFADLVMADLVFQVGPCAPEILLRLIERSGAAEGGDINEGGDLLANGSFRVPLACLGDELEGSQP
jgi:hypothetical protein